MWIDITILVLSLGIILTGCELFTNSIEWLGRMLGVGDGVVGSIFSAVGTCLPETSVPVMAILSSKSIQKSSDICIGAIIGAPFMLGTLAFFITGMSVVVFRRRQKMRLAMNVNAKILKRDIEFFIFTYSIGIAAALFEDKPVKNIIAFFLIASYVYYIFLTVKSDRAGHGKVKSLYLKKFMGLKSNEAIVFIQIALSLAGIITGAELFVRNIGEVSQFLGISALTLSLIITPIATELPEKFNSIIWIRRKKDTLALGNITGAMVFQSCIPVSIGIAATQWQLDAKAFVSVMLTMASSAFVYLWVRLMGRLTPFPLLMGGLFYAIFIVLIFTATI